MNVLAGATMALALTVTAQAQNPRSFVATTGVDTNNCTAAAYCRTFARALAVTNSGGEIVVVNSGGYGPFSITQAVVITAIGIDAAITQTASGQNAITINTTGNVAITGLNLSGGGTGNDGIQIQNVGVLHLYSMQVQNFANYGIEFDQGTALSIYDSKVSDNGAAGLVTEATAYVHNTTFDNNLLGAASLAGYLAIVDSSAQRNNVGFEANGGTVALDRDSVSMNVNGMVVYSGSSMYFAHCLVSGNTSRSYYVYSGGTLAGTSPGTSLIAPGQLNTGVLATATNLQ